MGWFNKKIQESQKRPQPVVPIKPKKGKCKIRFKKKDNVEDIEFSSECSPQQIEMAKQMRAERNGREEE